MGISAHVGLKVSPPTSAGATFSRPVGLTGLTVEDIGNSRLAEWNRLVDQVPTAGFFHGSVWMEVLHAAYGFKTMGLVLRRGGTIVGLIPMTEVANPLKGSRGVSLPFADQCPPLIPSSHGIEDLLPAMVEVARTRGWQYLEIRGTCDSFHPTAPAVQYFGHRIELTSNPQTLWKRLKGPIRTGVRKAESAGVVIEFSTSRESLGEFYRLYRLTRQHHGLPPQPYSFFEAVHERILAEGHGWITLARVAGKCVAAVVFFHRGERALFKYGASDARFQRLRANNLVLWSALKRSAENGCTLVDLGRTSSGNQGLRRYKQGWASVEFPIEYVKYDLRKNRFVEEFDAAVGWYNWAFRLAPRWMSAVAGKVLYKYWA